MLNFKLFTFINYLSEELTPSQKKEVGEWPRDSEALRHTDHYFGRDNDVVHHELEGTQDKSEVHKAVERHLGQEIHPDDYKEGVTNDKYGRKVKIGGLLSKSKAPKELVNNFANDSTRQGKKFTGLSVKISRHPHDVAGQTSKGQSWENESCKNFENGSNRRYLPDEVKHGTVVGYLRDHTGKEIARSTLQPHINDEGHRIYAVDSHYGIDHEGFKKHMEKVADDLSGEHKGGNIIYKKHDKVYNDSGDEEAIHPRTSKEHIHEILNHGRLHEREAALNPRVKLDSSHIDRALNDKNSDVREKAIKHPAATSKHIDHALDTGDDDLKSAAMKNPNATEKHIDKALKDRDDYVRVLALLHPNVKSHHIDVGLNDHEAGVRRAALSNENKLSHDQINKALNDDDKIVRMKAALHPNTSKEQIHKALGDKTADVRHAAISNKNATSDHIEKALNDSNYVVRGTAAKHHNATSDQIHKGLSDEDSFVRERALSNRNATKEHFDTALNDENEAIRERARVRIKEHAR